MRADLCIGALAALLAAMLPVCARAATLQVPSEYATIQEAVDAAASGDLVLVAPGTYFESVVLAGKTLTLASHFFTTGDPSFIGQTVIDGGGGERVVFVDSSVGPATAIVGLTIQNATDGIAAEGRFQLLDCRITGTTDGLDYTSGGGLVRGCVIEGNADDGIDLDKNVSVLIEDNDILDNGGNPSPDGDGIEIRLQPYNGPMLEVVIRNNRIHRNTSDGIQFIGYDVGTQRRYRIEGNSFVGNHLAAIGMMCCQNSSEDLQAASLPERIWITRNTFSGNGWGISGGDNSIVLDNLFVDTANLALKDVDGSSIAAYNGFWQNGSDASGSNVDVASGLYQDPLLDANLALLPGSPAVDAGTAFYQHLAEVVLDLAPASYAGAAPDLGAFETGAPGPPNQPPFVDAGRDQVLPSASLAQLDASVVDDGLPDGSLDLTWIELSGPGTVTFGDPTAEDTTASFSEDGAYVLRLTADDSDLGGSDDVRITLTPEAQVLELPLADAVDDAEEDLGTGSVELNSDVLDLGSSGSRAVGLRWESVGVPPGSQINAAWVQFQVAGTNNGAADLEIRGELAADAAPFANVPGNLTDRLQTGSWATWQPPGWPVSRERGLDQRTADLSVVVDEIVNGTAWQAGNALALLVTGTGLRRAEAFEGRPGGAAVLHLAYSPPVGNQAPVVDAGPDASIVLGQQASLAGDVTDDGLPAGQPLDILWTLESGPGSVTIEVPTDVATQASFSAPGVYVLRLTANDGELTSFDEMQVTAVANQPPSVDAGPDRSIEISEWANLAGSASDDGLPGGGLSVLWSAESGPGAVTFASPAQPIGQAQFSAPGLYVLRLSADDGQLVGSSQMRVAVAARDDGVHDAAIGAADDDAEEELSKNQVELAGSELELGQQSAGSRREQIVGLRFAGVEVPAGAAILSARVQLQAASGSSGTADLVIEAEASDDAAAFQAVDGDLSGRPRTASSRTWIPPAWSAGAAGADQATPDLGPLVQEVVDRSGWASGNALVVLITGPDGTRTAESYEGDPGGAAQLQLTYAAAACADGIDNDGDGAVDFPDDSGCADPASDVENPACSDGIDNDGNGLVDFPDDPGCSDPTGALELSDGDADGIPDAVDNCTDVSNPLQIDTNGDGFGNACDADYDDDGLVQILDWGIFAAAFGRTCADPDWNPHVDSDGDCVIQIVDFGVLAASFGGPPGPSSQAP